MSFKDYILSKSNKNKSDRLKEENDYLTRQIQVNYKQGISVVIPTYKGEKYINTLLDSIKEQKLSPELFELIFIINGAPDSTPRILNNFIQENEDLNVIIAYTSTPNVGNARNIGIRIAEREFITFLDDDDYISPDYLNSLYNHSKPNRIAMANFIDEDSKTGEKLESYVIRFKEKRNGVIENAPADFFNLTMVTVAKSIPTYAAKLVEFNSGLNNGEDISYFGRFYPQFDFEFYFIDKNEEAIYYRIKRENSVSKQEMLYEFNILDRLKVLDDINSLFETEKRENYVKFLKKIFKGQSTYIVKYIKENPDEKQKVLDEIEKHDFNYFPYDKLKDI